MIEGKRQKENRRGREVIHKFQHEDTGSNSFDLSAHTGAEKVARKLPLLVWATFALFGLFLI